MLEVHPWLVTGAGGSRIDFIAGWLGYQPYFINTNWAIDPNTGQSTSEAGLIKQLDFNPSKTLSDVFKERFNFIAGKNKNLNYCGCLHGYDLNNQLDVDATVLYIHVPSHLIEKVKWEFFVKTYLSKMRISDINNNVDKLELINQHIINIQYYRIPDPHADAIILNYEELFKPDGSHYLCDTIGITSSEKLHQYYNHMLQWSDSPLEIEAYGKLWKFSDYFKQ